MEQTADNTINNKNKKKSSIISYDLHVKNEEEINVLNTCVRSVIHQVMIYRLLEQRTKERVLLDLSIDLPDFGCDINMSGDNNASS